VINIVEATKTEISTAKHLDLLRRATRKHGRAVKATAFAELSGEGNPFVKEQIFTGHARLDVLGISKCCTAPV
jgi:hypothetical protein